MTTTIDGQSGAVIEHDESLAPAKKKHCGNIPQFCVSCGEQGTIKPISATPVSQTWECSSCGIQFVQHFRVDPVTMLVNAGVALFSSWLISKIPQAPVGEAEKQRKRARTHVYNSQRKQRRRKKRRSRLFLK